jgi:excisionase family DNA binding protein
MTPVLELLTKWYPDSWKDPLLLPIRESITAAGCRVDEYMTADEAAAYLKVHVETLRKWVRLGVFPHIPFPGAGKNYRFSKTSIDEWARARTVGKPK